jgi:hypothetical protein
LVPVLIKYKGYKEGQVRRLASEWEDSSGTVVEDGEHAVRLSGQVLTRVYVEVLPQWWADYTTGYCSGSSNKYPVLVAYADKKRGNRLGGFKVMRKTRL